jgi:hypothetical protein
MSENPKRTKGNGFDVRPDVGIFTVIQHLSYKPQYALAEYIDNSISSWESNKSALEKLHKNYKLQIDIEVGDDIITVRDNAAGIPRDQYPRAFKPAELPPDRKGLNEFGMGMKTASIWLSKDWQVVTTAIGEDQTGIVSFNVEEMIKKKDGVIFPTFRAKLNSKHHGTTITLRKLNHHRINLPTIRNHLADIYRSYLRDESIVIRVFRSEEDENDPETHLAFTDLPSLEAEAAYPNGPQGKIKWVKSININFDTGEKIKGVVRILAEGSTSKAGLYLFRRNRMIIGTNEPYRPEAIFKKTNSFIYQRVYGELSLEGFEVTHTKDDIIWGSGKGPDEDTVIAAIKSALESDGVDLLLQASNYRANKLRKNVDLEMTIEKTTGELELEIQTKAETLNNPENTPSSAEEAKRVEEIEDKKEQKAAEKDKKVRDRSFKVIIAEQPWKINITTTEAGPERHMFESSIKQIEDEEDGLTTVCDVKINITNSFALNYINRDEEYFEIILRFAVAAAIAKGRCLASKLKFTNTMIRHINDNLSILDGSIPND